jgi:hypothetical protein
MTYDLKLMGNIQALHVPLLEARYTFILPILRIKGMQASLYKDVAGDI